MQVELVQTFDDFAALDAIEEAAAERYRSLGYNPDPWPPTAPEDFIEARRTNLLWVALVEGLAQGFLVVQVHYPFLHVDELNVHPSIQGRGIGRQFIEAAFAEARRRHCEALTLRVFRQADWSVGLYRKMGFEFSEAPLPHIHIYQQHERDEGLPSDAMGTMIAPINPTTP